MYRRRFFFIANVTRIWGFPREGEHGTRVEYRRSNFVCVYIDAGESGTYKRGESRCRMRNVADVSCARRIYTYYIG